MSSVPYSTLVSDDSVPIFLSIVDAVAPLWSLCCRLPVLLMIHFQGFRFRLYTLPISALVHLRLVSLLACSIGMVRTRYVVDQNS